MASTLLLFPLPPFPSQLAPISPDSETATRPKKGQKKGRNIARVGVDIYQETGLVKKEGNFSFVRFEGGFYSQPCLPLSYISHSYSSRERPESKNGGERERRETRRGREDKRYEKPGKWRNKNRLVQEKRRALKKEDDTRSMFFFPLTHAKKSHRRAYHGKKCAIR